ncbi:hypothetical protein GLOIN_2v1780244 [Rhizophagus clarus]|uniref:Uncharacterized protein n=1 Tax=Rhizophagus clarus TaxID=94130 RepID=A0A8H3LAE1_9GLOM|nr:hypothetical protein GLOIN_2v1780244 [Rhizophagus clarus]
MVKHTTNITIPIIIKKFNCHNKNFFNFQILLDYLLINYGVSNDTWDQAVPAILSLIGILEKYVQYLNEAIIIMSKHHHSDESTRSPENNCSMYQTAACKRDNLKDKYRQLNDFLFEKQIYEYINIQQYLSNDVMKRYRFIKELQLMFLIGIYRFKYIYL